MKKPRPELLLSREMDVVLELVLSHEPDVGRAEYLVKDGLNWVSLRELAIRHGVLPLLFTRLKNVEQDLVPPAEMAAMRTLFLANIGHNLLLTHRLIQVLDLLSSKGIEAIPFKGPILASQAYGDLSLRSFLDLDILIHQNDFMRVHDVLTHSGFSIQATNRTGFNSRFPSDKKMQRWLVRSQPALHFVGKGVHLDVHWAFVERWPSIHPPPEQVWQTLKTIVLHGKEIRTLSDENTLRLTWTHGVKHRWGSIQWIADIINQARTCPDYVQQILTEQIQVIPRYELSAFRLAVTDPVGFARHALAERSKFSLGLCIRGLLLGAFAPKQTDWMTTELPDCLYSFYYVLRPCRLCWKYTRKFARLVLKSRSACS